jgi:hypothetical protein
MPALALAHACGESTSAGALRTARNALDVIVGLAPRGSGCGIIHVALRRPLPSTAKSEGAGVDFFFDLTGKVITRGMHTSDADPTANRFAALALAV